MRTGHLVVAAALTFVALAACGDDAESPPSGERGTPVTTPPLAGPAAAAEGLCLTLKALEEDPGSAADVFLDRAHDRLHEIANALQENATKLAGKLLELKQRVESKIDSDPEDEGLRVDVASLLSTTEAALDKLGIPAPECPR